MTPTCYTCHTDQQPFYKIPINYKYPTSRKTYMESHIIDTPLSVVERPDDVAKLMFLDGVQFCESCVEPWIHTHATDIPYRFVLPLIQKYTIEKMRVLEIENSNINGNTHFSSSDSTNVPSPTNST